MKLIVTEKDNSAKKIAQILSAGKAKEGKAYSIPFYTYGEGDDATLVIGLKGHLMNPAFPEEYSEWRKVEPRALIDAELLKEPVQQNVHKALRKQAKDADSVVIATDYDREGELIGLEALEEILDVNPKLAEDGTVTGAHITRARYSALTKEEIEEAFTNLVELSRAAGAGRRGASGHRPDLGRDADPLRLAGDRPAGLAVPERRPRAEPDAGDRRRARAGAPRARRRAVLGGARDLRAPRRGVHRTPQGRPLLGRGRGQGGARRTRAAPAR